MNAGYINTGPPSKNWTCVVKWIAQSERNDANGNIVNVNNDVALSSSYSKSTWNSEICITNVRGTYKGISCFEGEHLDRVWTSQA